MTDLEKLEYIKCAILEIIDLIPDLDEDMDGELSNALKLVEQLQEPLLPESDEDEEPRVPWLTKGELWALEQKDKKDD